VENKIMKIQLNGEKKNISAGTTIRSLLEQVNLNQEHLVVEVNLEIIPKENFSSHILKENDRVELIHFMGGGKTLRVFPCYLILLLEILRFIIIS